MKSKGLLFILVILFSLSYKFTSPLYSQSRQVYLNSSAIKSFSENSNYMSVEGYVMLRHKINTGETITRSQAKRIYKRSVKLDEKNSNINKALQTATGKD